MYIPQHAKAVAPVPTTEHGDALPGMSAGGVAAITSASPPTLSSTTDNTDDKPEEESHLTQKHHKLDSDEVAMSSANNTHGEKEARAQRRADALEQSRGKGYDEVETEGGHADVEELHGATDKSVTRNETGSGDKTKQETAQKGDTATGKKGHDSVRGVDGTGLNSTKKATEGKSSEEEGSKLDGEQTGAAKETEAKPNRRDSKEVHAEDSKHDEQKGHGGSEIKGTDPVTSNHGNLGDMIQRQNAEKFGVNLAGDV
ncbi:hypothetical protein GMOD_00003461 [Pyrenophora seminiperda CCB06]|uniref:Uncharacterized protein n=1 Tax=Pyrenophora seminiperda CCB06 TaxID=1302712 RepID=A0A3M7MJ80_9PLEO|nr:hypothetical protein GMOD_00003461 [Pyrenophora seminiperda CCB06]